MTAKPPPVQIVTGQQANGWNVVADTTTSKSVCEVPASLFTCPQRPPGLVKPDPGDACARPLAARPI
jgi:hypothetical protein